VVITLAGGLGPLMNELAVTVARLMDGLAQSYLELDGFQLYGHSAHMQLLKLVALQGPFGNNKYRLLVRKLPIQQLGQLLVGTLTCSSAIRSIADLEKKVKK